MPETYQAVDKERQALRLEVERLRAELSELKTREAKLIEFIRTAPVASGVCCCGQSMDGHADPMVCGHTPKDQWDWSVECVLKVHGVI